MKGSAYVLVVIGILLAKCCGFLRDIVFASSFGASEYTDIYFQIFGVASLVFTGIGGALSTLVIKNLNKSENANPQRQKEYVAGFILKTSVIIILVLIVAYSISDVLTNLLLPGLEGDMHHVGVDIMHIMLPSCLFVVVAYIMAGVLQNSGVFFITSVMSLPYNMLIIAALLMPKADIKLISIITTIGWFLHLAVLLPSFLKKGYRFTFKIGKNEGKASGNKEALFIFISSMMFQLVFIIDKASVSSDTGAASTINYASNLFITIASVFVVAMSNVSYPSICRHFEGGNKEMVKKILQYIIVVLLAIFVPFLLTVTCFGKDFISLLYERGEFTSAMSAETATLFAIYSFGIFGYVCQELLNKVLYLDGKYVCTVAGTLFVVILKPFVNFFLCSESTYMTAVSTTILFALYAVCILWVLTKSVGNYFSKGFCANVFKILLSGALAFIALKLLSFISLPFDETKFAFFPRLLICALVYVGMLGISGGLKYMLFGQKNALKQE